MDNKVQTLIDLGKHKFDLVKLGEDHGDDLADENKHFLIGMVLRIRSVLNDMLAKPRIGVQFSQILESYTDLYVKLHNHIKILELQERNRNELEQNGPFIHHVEKKE